jgi:hypothetical protein
VRCGWFVNDLVDTGSVERRRLLAAQVRPPRGLHPVTRQMLPPGIVRQRHAQR